MTFYIWKRQEEELKVASYIILHKDYQDEKHCWRLTVKKSITTY